EDGPRWMNYYGPPNFIPSVSYYQALQDALLVPEDFFRGKVVFIGSRLMTKFAGERKDQYRNPYSFWLSNALLSKHQALFSPGVEVQATAFLNLLREDWFRRLSWSTETVFIA